MEPDTLFADALFAAVARTLGMASPDEASGAYVAAQQQRRREAWIAAGDDPDVHWDGKRKTWNIEVVGHKRVSRTDYAKAVYEAKRLRGEYDTM